MATCATIGKTGKLAGSDERQPIEALLLAAGAAQPPSLALNRSPLWTRHCLWWLYFAGLLLTPHLAMGVVETGPVGGCGTDNDNLRRSGFLVA